MDNWKHDQAFASFLLNWSVSGNQSELIGIFSFLIRFSDEQACKINYSLERFEPALNIYAI